MVNSRWAFVVFVTVSKSQCGSIGSKVLHFRIKVAVSVIYVVPDLVVFALHMEEGRKTAAYVPHKPPCR